jgi:hypothetical protein
MNPIIKQMWTPEDFARWGIRGIDDFMVEKLARLHQKVEGWIRQRAPHPERTRRRPWVMTTPRAANRA